jgi:hypothetical protein
MTVCSGRWLDSRQSNCPGGQRKQVPSPFDPDQAAEWRTRVSPHFRTSPQIYSFFCPVLFKSKSRESRACHETCESYQVPPFALHLLLAKRWLGENLAPIWRGLNSASHGPPASGRKLCPIQVRSPATQPRFSISRIFNCRWRVKELLTKLPTKYFDSPGGGQKMLRLPIRDRE